MNRKQFMKSLFIIPVIPLVGIKKKSKLTIYKGASCGTTEDQMLNGFNTIEANFGKPYDIYASKKFYKKARKYFKGYGEKKC